jgi:hypothetical protein
MNAKRFVLFAIPLMVAVTAAAATSQPNGAVIDPTCTSSLPCIEYDNNGSGPGIRGISLGGNGVSGSTKANTSSTHAGLFGNDISTSGFVNAGVRGLSVRGSGIVGQTTSGDGVFANSSSGIGVEGMSQSSIGVEGFTTSSSSAGVHGFSVSGFGVAGDTGNTSSSSSKAGVFGLDGSTTMPDRNEGVFGVSTLNIGVEGTTVGGIGVEGIAGSANASGGTAFDAVATGSASGISALADTGRALLARNSGTNQDDAVFSTGSFAGEAFIGISNGVGLEAAGFAFSGTVPALNASCSGAPAMTATNRGSGDIMSLDCSGNMILKGGLTTLGTPLVARRNAAGSEVGAFSPQQTAPTMEDLGEAQLVNGQAYVSLAPDFAATIDRHTNYLVFITPQGESRGLYVTQKSSAGFAVRESGAGRSTVAFDYRIVAKPYGELSQRLPALQVNMHPDASMLALMQRAIRAKAQVSAELARARDQVRQAARTQRQARAISQQVKPPARVVSPQ